MSSSRSSDKEDLTCPYVYIPVGFFLFCRSELATKIFNYRNFQDEFSRFKQFLHEKGKYVSIRSTLKNKIVNLLDQKFVIDSPDWYNMDNQVTR